MEDHIEMLFEQYLHAAAENDAVACADLVQPLDDVTAKALYTRLASDPRTAQRLVRPLWFNYSTQKMRWEGK